jgi:undecaprenyl-phosphate galactose phosphotransferase
MAGGHRRAGLSVSRGIHIVQRTERLRGVAQTAITLALDLALLVLSLKLAVHIRTGLLPHIYAAYDMALPFESVLDIWWVFLVWLFFFAYEGLYTAKFSYWDEIRSCAKASFFASVGVFTIVSLGKLSAEVSRTVIVLMGFIAMFALPFARTWAKGVLRRFGLFRRRVLILGAGDTGELILKALRKETNLGFHVVGFLDDDPAKSGTRIEGVKVHRGVDRAARYLNRADITDVVIAMPGAGRERLQGLINSLQHKARRVMFVPDVFGMAVLGTKLQHFFEEQAFALEVQNNLSRPLNYWTKRLFDYAASLCILLVLAVPLALLALAVRLTSPGPALYGHRRVGRNSREFRCLKFRTMYADADRRLSDILASDPEAKEEWETHRKITNDPRVTPVGRFLRKTSLDELPQLFNVLKGDMSLVGPRPVMQDEIEQHYKEMAELCFSVMPGITGLWQVSGRSDTSYDYRIALDAWYVRNWNLWQDVVILFKTVRAVFRAAGAR